MESLLKGQNELPKSFSMQEWVEKNLKNSFANFMARLAESCEQLPENIREVLASHLKEAQNNLYRVDVAARDFFAAYRDYSRHHLDSASQTMMRSAEEFSRCQVRLVALISNITSSIANELIGSINQQVKTLGKVQDDTKIIGIRCPHCDARVSFPEGAERGVCEYCKTEILLSKKIEQHIHYEVYNSTKPETASLSRIDPLFERAQSIALKVISSPDSFENESTIDALRGMKEAGALALAKISVESTSRFDRDEAFETLLQMGKGSHIGLGYVALNSDDVNQRSEAIEALGKKGQKSSLVLAQVAINSDYKEDRDAAIEALREMGRAGIVGLAEIVSKSEYDDEVETAKELLAELEEREEVSETVVGHKRPYDNYLQRIEQEEWMKEHNRSMLKILELKRKLREREAAEAIRDVETVPIDKLDKWQEDTRRKIALYKRARRQELDWKDGYYERYGDEQEH